MRFNLTEGEYVELAAPAAAAGQRLDMFLAAALPAPSRTYARRLCDHDLVRVTPGKGKPGYRLKGGEQVRVFIPAVVEMSSEPEDIPLTILYEDEDIVVIDKQAHMVVHPSPGHETGTLVNALLHHCGELSRHAGAMRPGIVHRLDRDTTGCMVVARHDAAHQELAAQFASRTVAKTYLAITNNAPRPPVGELQTYIGRHPSDRQAMAVVERGGRLSFTAYRTVETFQGHSLVECRPHTGRTHQIRVHMKHLGAPLLCDRIYGPVPGRIPLPLLEVIDRQALHAWRLEFDHPRTNERLRFTAELPADMERALELLRGGTRLGRS